MSEEQSKIAFGKAMIEAIKLSRENAELRGQLDACEQHVKILLDNEGIAGREIEKLRGLLKEWDVVWNDRSAPICDLVERTREALK